MIRAILPMLLLTFAPMQASAGSKASDALTELRASAPIEIEDTGIAAFDAVFGSVRAIHQTLDGAQNSLIGAQDKVALAVGAKPGTSIAMSLWTMKQRAGGPIAVQMQGTKPVLTIGGAGSNEGRNMVATINSAVSDVAAIPLQLAAIPQQIMGLVDAVKAMPAQLNPALLKDAGLSVTSLPKVGKILSRNVKATVATPKRCSALVSASTSFVRGIPQGIAATSAPLEGNGKVAKIKAPKAPKAAKPAKAPKQAQAFALPTPAVEKSSVGKAVDTALKSFHDAEVETAKATIAAIDKNLGMAREPVPVADLESLYQTQALIYLVDGNAAAASAAVTQALIVNPSGQPIKALGPEYARIHKALSKAGLLRTVTITIQGSGSGMISGKPITPGQVEVAAGKHLVQVNRGGQWVSQLVYLKDGATITL